jgi:hypothetical protein
VSAHAPLAHLVRIALVAGLLAPAQVRAQAVVTPNQCRSYTAVFDYYGGSAHFQNFGLTVAQCQALCRKHAGRCKAFLSLARSCARKAIKDQLAIDLATDCDTLADAGARKSCRASAKSAAAEQLADHDAAVAELRGNCEVVVRDWCSDECEP